MNIGLITYPIETNPTGIGVHVLNLAKKLLEIDKENIYFLLHFTASENPVYNKNEILYRHFKHLPIMFSDSWYLKKRSGFFDIVHRFSPGGFLFNIRSKIVITVHDLFAYHPYHFNRKTFRRSGRFFIKNSLKKADAVVTDSEFTKNEVLKTFPIDKNSVHVVNCAPGISLDKKNVDKTVLKDKYGISRDFILFVSTIEPRKNLLGLVQAYERLREHYDIDEYLVIVGGKGWDFDHTLTYINASKSRDRIVLTGFVPDEDLPLFYRHANLFVYPSFMEGFGIPPLEAMSCGCPVLTSNTSSLPEVVQHGEMMFDPHNTAEIAEKSIKILKNASARENNIKKGQENIKRFNWRKSAEKMMQIYNSIGKEA